ncbi:MAG: hypothetical protein AAF409_19595 [Pseudomonadota bacterium]
MTKNDQTPVTLPDADLDEAQGGVGMLLPAVQQAREAARMTSATEADKLGNFEIQDLMSRFNQAETLASSVQKKDSDTKNAIIGKI